MMDKNYVSADNGLLPCYSDPLGFAFLFASSSSPTQAVIKDWHCLDPGLVAGMRHDGSGD